MQTPTTYVPCLRWKQGEYQALLELPDDVRPHILPLIEVAEIGWDFELEKDCKTVDEHLSTFARRVSDKWGRNGCYVDLVHIDRGNQMEDGSDPATFIFEGLRQRGIPAIPVLRTDEAPERLTALQEAVAAGPRVAALRSTLVQASRSDFATRVDSLLEQTGVEAGSVHLILDLQAPNFNPVHDFAVVVESIIRRLPHLEAWLTFTLLGTAFPATMAELERGLSRIERSEWILYQAVIRRLAANGVRIPAFGDYGVANPDVPRINPRFLRPSASLRYTVDDAWLIAKGVNVREHKFSQYRELCELVIRSGEFSGPQYSSADQYILDCAAGTASTGNLSVWRRVGTNRHLVKVSRDLSTLSAPSFSA